MYHNQLYCDVVEFKRSMINCISIFEAAMYNRASVVAL